MTGDRSAGRSLLAWLPVAVSAAIAAPFCFDAIRETDAGWHLALGRKLLEEGIFFRNGLSWTAPDQPWYPTSWLYDVAGWALYAPLGPLGLQLLTFLLVMLTLAAIAVALAQIDLRMVWLTPAAALLLAPRLTERPHVASWAALACTLALCLLAQRTSQRRWRALCLAVIALGSNLHAGAIFAAVVLGAFCLEEYWRRRDPRELVLAAFGGLALLANPGGLFNVRYAVEHLSVQEVIVLEEFLRPTLTSFPAYFVLAPLTLVAAALLGRKRPALLLLGVAFVPLGFFAARLVFKFHLVALVTLAAALIEFARRDERIARLGVLVVFALAALSGSATGVLTFAPPEARFDEMALPVRAAGFIREARIEGKLFNGFSDGGFLELAVPGLQAFQDSRVQAYPPEFFRRLQEAERSPEAFRALLDELGVEWAVTTRLKERLGGYGLLNDAPGWSLVYWDEISEVYLRRDVARFAEPIAQYEFRHFRPWGSILGPVVSLTRSELERYSREVDRFERTAPDFAFSAVVRCALAIRQTSDSMPVDCARAELLAGDGPAQAILTRALTLPPLETHAHPH